jgi:hypothetical protein
LNRLVFVILFFLLVQAGANQPNCVGSVAREPLTPSVFSKLIEQKGRTHVVELPYTTPRIEGRLVEAPGVQLPIEVPHTIALFSTSRPTEVIMTLAMKIGHAPFVKIFPADLYVIVAFESPTALASFTDSISGSYELRANYDGKPAVIMSVAQTFIAQNKLAPASSDALKKTVSQPVSLEELKSLSTYNVRTTGGTVYYFKDQTPIGFSKGGRSERYINLKNPKEGFATHEEILKRQLGIQFRPTGSIDDQIRQGRIFSNEKLHEIGLGEDSADISRVKDALQSGWKATMKVKELITEIANKRLPVIEAALSKYFESDFSLFADPKLYVNENPQKLPADGIRNFRFLQLKTDETKPGLLILSRSNLLHSMMFEMALGPTVSDLVTSAGATNVIKMNEIVEGGLLRIKYDETGRANIPVIAEGTMSLRDLNVSTGRSLNMDEARASVVEGLLQSIFFRFR